MFSASARSHSAVSLPAVSLTEFALTGDVVASSTVVADAAAGNMINDDAVAFFEAFQAFALFHDLSAGFVTCYHSGDIPLRSFSGVLPVNAADIASADGRCLCLDQHLTVSRLRNPEGSHPSSTF